MAHAYTPGLKVADGVELRKRRILPLEGNVLVAEGDRVEADTAVARAELPGRVHPLNLANLLGVGPRAVRGCMLKTEGGFVEAGELIAESKSWLPFLRSRCRAPVKGSVESISDVTGQVMLREPPRAVVVSAFVSGRVVEVLPGEGAVVETRCAFAQGIFGVGGERIGPLRCLDVPPDADVPPGAVPDDCAGAVLVGGAFAGRDTLEKAMSARAAAFVTGGIDARDLRELLGYDIGVAVTGSEALPMTLIVTEGFGRIPMAHRTAGLLRRFDGRRASVNGATQIRAGVMRPEIIIPHDGVGPAPIAVAPAARQDGIHEDDEVRMIREPYFGQIGRVARLVAEPVRIETEAAVRALEIALDDGSVITVPRANVEVLQQ